MYVHVKHEECFHLSHGLPSASGDRLASGANPTFALFGMPSAVTAHVLVQALLSTHSHAFT